jgi:hypothetical protein
MIVDADHPFAKDMFVYTRSGKTLFNIVKFDPTTGEIWQFETDDTGKFVSDETGEHIKIRHVTFPAPLTVLHRDGRAYDIRTINNIEYLVEEQFELDLRKAAKQATTSARAAYAPSPNRTHHAKRNPWPA